MNDSSSKQNPTFDIDEPSNQQNPTSPIENEPSNQENPTSPIENEPSKEQNPTLAIDDEPSNHENPTATNPQEPPASPIPFKQSNLLHFKATAKKLKRAIAPLADTELNPEGVGTIKMSAWGFVISVCNRDTNVLCRLFLESNALSEFEYPSTLRHKEKTANVFDIFQRLSAVPDDDIVTVYHPYFSAQLFFQIGNEPTSVFSVELVEPVSDITEEMFPNYSTPKSCDRLVSRRQLKKLIKDLLQPTKKTEPPLPLVSAVVLSRNAFIAAGEEASEAHKKLQAAERSTSNHATFCWYHAQSLKKASELSDARSAAQLYVKLIGEPLNCVMLRFEHAQFTTLLYLTHTDTIVFSN